MKHSVISAALCLLGLATQSQAAVMEVGYCYGEVSSQSVGKVGNCNVSAAVILSPETLKPFIGANITGIRLYLATTDNLTGLTAWVRDDLTADNLAEGTGVIQEGWQTVAIDGNLKVGNSPIAIGYTFNQTKTSKCITLGGDIVPDGHYYAKRGEWESLPDPSGSICLELVVEGDNVAASDLWVESLSLINPLVKEGENFVLKAKVRNNSLNAIEGFAYSATTPIINHNLVDVVWEKTLQPKQAVELEIDMPTANFPINEPFSLTFCVKDEGNLENNIRETACGVYDEAFPRQLLMEEFTTEQCPNCPRAINSISSAMENGYGEHMVVIAHHVGFYTDWLTLPEESALLWFYGDDGSFAPAGMYDRTIRTSDLTTPVESIGYYDTFSSRLDEAIGKPGFVKINISANADDTEVRVTVDALAHPLLKTILADPHLTVVLTEDGIKHVDQAGISNPEFTHSHVSRAYLTGIFGDAVEFDADGRLHWTRSIPLDQNWVCENMEVVAFINAYDSDDRTACEVYNVAATHLAASAVGELTEVSETGVEYYDLQGRRITAPGRGVTIMRMVFPDGTVTTAKTIR